MLIFGNLQMLDIDLASLASSQGISDIVAAYGSRSDEGKRQL